MFAKQSFKKAKSIFVPLCTKINKKVRKHDLDFEGKLQIKTMIQFNDGENCKIAAGCISKRNNDYVHFCISVRDHLARHMCNNDISRVSNYIWLNNEIR